MRKSKFNKIKEKEIIGQEISGTNPDKNLFCYLRVSSDKQKKENNSIPLQREIGKRVSKRLGLNYIEVNEGGTSSQDRNDDTKFKYLQRLITEGKVKHIWVFDRDRLSRDVHEDTLIKRTLVEPNGVTIYEGDSGTPRDTKEPTSDFVDTLFTSIKQLDKLQRRKRSISGKVGLYEMIGDKQPRHLGGTIIFGYQSVDRVVEVHPENSKHVKTMYEMYSQGNSTKDIKLYLETNGVKTSRGNSHWTLVSIIKILSNEHYKGFFKWTDKDSGKTLMNVRPRLISESLYNKVQKMIEKNQKNKGDNKRLHDSLFGQKMICGCGTKYVTQQHKRNNSKQGPYFSKSYYCWSKNKEWKGELGIVCNNRRSLEMDLTDEFLLKHIEDVVRNSHKFKEDFKNKILGRKKEIVENYDNQKLMIQKRIDKKNHDMGLLYESISKIHLDKTLGKKPSSLCDQMISDLEKTIIQYEDEKSHSEQEIKDIDNMNEWVNWIDQYGEDITNKLSDKIKTKEMVENLIDKITVSEVIGKDRDEKNVQIGHRFEIHFKQPIVNDKMIYKDENRHSKGYHVQSGRRLSKTSTLKGFTKHGVNKVGYVRKKKTKKTQQTQYVETDEHHVQSKQISHSGIVLVGHGGYVLSGSVPYLCFTTITQSNDLIYLPVYSVRQNILYLLIRYLHEKRGMGYRKISTWLNRSGIKTQRGKKFSNGSVYSVLKRKSERDIRIKTIRQKKFDFILKDMRIEYFNHS